MRPLALLAALVLSSPALADGPGSQDVPKFKKGAGSGDAAAGSPVKLDDGAGAVAKDCLFASDDALWTANGWKNLSSGGFAQGDLYPNGSGGGSSKVLFLNAVVLNDAGWTVDLVRSQMQLLAKIYRQCGIKLGGVTYLFADSPIGKVDLDGAIGLNSNDPPDLAKRVPDIPSNCPAPGHKPLLFLFRSFLDKRGGFSYPASLYPDPAIAARAAKIIDTSWLPSDELPKENPGYGNAAHEVGHVLGLDHTVSGEPRKNLMHADVNKSDGTLWSAQCATMLGATNLLR